MASTKLTRNMGTQGSSIKGTFSAWVKRASTGSDHDIYQHNYSSNYRFAIRFRSADDLSVGDYRNGWIMERVSNAKYRDCHAWYHIYVAIDRSLATAGDRQKVYVNGERLTSFAASTDYDQQTTGSHTGSHSMNNDYTSIVGGREDSSDYFDGIISHLYWVDGSVIDIAQFGSTDATTGEWKIETSPTIASYGTNGHSILKDGPTITDQSSGSNDFTLANGTLTKSEDCPSDVFATWNVRHNGFEAATYSNGNTTIATGGSNKYTWNNSTIGMTAGKYYAEIKWKANGTDVLIGLTDRFSNNATEELGNYSTQYAYRNNGQIYNSNSGSAWGNTFAIGDIIGIAVDMDNNKLYFSKNGTWENSGDPTSGSTGTGAVALSASPQNDCYYFSVCGYEDVSITFEANFGNGYFGTTAVSSAGTNASNIGIFEYDVPAGYSALSTKGLNE